MSKIENELAFYEACLKHYRTRVKTLKAEILERKERLRSSGGNRGNVDNRKKLKGEHFHFESTRPGMVRISSPFGDDLEQLRFLSLRLHTEHVDEVTEVFAFEANNVQRVRRSMGGNLEIKALVYNDHEGIRSLTLQRWDNRGKSPVKEAITLQGGDLARFMIFIVSSFYTEFPDDRAVRVMIDKLKQSVEDIANEHAQSRMGRLEALMSKQMGEEF